MITRIIRQNKKILTFAIVQVCMLLLMGGIKIPHALAADPGSGAAAAEAPQISSGRYNTSIVNDPNAGTQITPYFDIGNNTSNFNYQSMDLNLYVDKTSTGSFTLKVTNAAPDCYNGGSAANEYPDYTENGGAPGVRYSILNSGNGTVDSKTVFGGGCSAFVYLSVPNVKTSSAYTMTGATSSYNGYFVFRAEIVAGSLGQGENSFRTNISSNTTPVVIGYVGGAGKVAGIGYRDTNLNSGNYWNGWLAFGTVLACSDLNNPNSTVGGTVSWQDLDLNQNSWNPAPAPSMLLYEQRVFPDGSLGAWNKLEDYNGYQLRNNGWENGSFITTSFKLGYRYKVVMANFGTRNTVRLNFDGQIRGIGANLAERPTIAKCYKATCTATVSPAGPYTLGQNVTVTIVAHNNALSSYGATWQPGTELLRRISPSGKNPPWGQLASPVPPQTAAPPFTDTVKVTSAWQYMSYQMFTNSGATAFGGSCSVPIPPPGQKPNNPALPWLEVSCSYTVVHNITGANMGATWHPNAANPLFQVPITQAPVQIRITSDPANPANLNPGSSTLYIVPGGVTIGSDSAPINTFKDMWPGQMWPHGTYDFDLIVQGLNGSVPIDSFTYKNDGAWGSPYYGAQQVDTGRQTGNCLSASCGNGSSPDLEPGETGNFDANIQFNNQTAQTFNSDSATGYNVRIDASPGLFNTPSSPIPVNIPAGPGTSGVNAGFTGRLDYTGSYSWTLLFSGGGGTQLDLPGLSNPCPTPPITPSTRPFFQVWGGDINTGGGFKTQDPVTGTEVCGNSYPDYVSPSTTSNPNSAGIKAFGYSDVSGFHGSLSDFGALSLGVIPDNSSAKISFGSTAKFSNTAVPYPGQLNSSPPDYCVTDFFDTTRKAGGPTNLSTPPTSLSSLSGSTTEQYIVSGQGVDNFGGGTVPAGNSTTPSRKITLYVDGDITITGNITYANWDPNNPDSAPSFALVVKGNINIAPNVTRIDGLYIAQPTSPGNDGEFNTCADNTGNQFCNQQFVANGAVIARLIRPLRSVGTVSLDANPAFSPAPGHLPAEIFNFIPSMVIAPNFAPTYNSLQGLFSLPPVF